MARWGQRGLMILAGLVASCCPIEIELTENPPRDVEPPTGDEGKGSPGDLGDARYPDRSRAKATNHSWWLKNLDITHYRLGYRMDKSAERDLVAIHRDFAKSVRHKKLSDTRFRWSPPKRCLGGLQCVYESMEKGSRDAVTPISALFEGRRSVAELSTADLTSLVLTFVQNIRYDQPDEEPFGVLPPAVVVRQARGDCDSKALLAHMILRDLGIDSVLISSNAHHHTMLGVRIPATGKSFTWRGARYAFLEITAERSPLGHIHPKLLRPNDWRVVPMRYAATGGRAMKGAERIRLR